MAPGNAPTGDSAMRSIFFLTLIGMVMVLAISAPADIIDSDVVPTFVSALYSDAAYPQWVAGSFVVEAGANFISTVQWSGLYHGTDTIVDDFTIAVFTDNGGNPADNAFWSSNVGTVASFDSGENAFGVDVYQYRADIAAPALEAGDTYYLSIFNNTPGSLGYWAWLTQDGEQQSWYRQELLDNSWIHDSDRDSLAFSLTTQDGPSTPTTHENVVPEPATLTLLGLGIAMSFVRGYRKR
jgi:hypothetical protein